MSMETERRQSFQRHAVLGTSIVLGLVMGALIGANSSVVSGVVTAAIVTGTVLVALVGAGAIIELARGDNAGPFIWLGALSGVVYIVASFYLSKRN